MKFVFIVFLVIAGKASAQRGESLVSAERNFARMAGDSGIRTAFLQHLDSAGIVFSAGTPLNGIQHFNRVQNRTALLTWRPVFAATAGSGDLGFTTGPFEYRQEAGGMVLSTGQYSSVWRKNEAGHWKLMVDMGTEFDSPFHSGEEVITFSNSIADKTQRGWLSVEAAFIDNYMRTGASAYADVIFDDSWFNIEGHRPLKSCPGILGVLDAKSQTLTFKILDGGISKSADMIYAYGQLSSGSTTGNYLRVWVHTADGWKILLQVMHW